MCKLGDKCHHLHILPATVGLTNEDYCDFAVVYGHLLTPTAPENKTVKVKLQLPGDQGPSNKVTF